MLPLPKRDLEVGVGARFALGGARATYQRRSGRGALAGAATPRAPFGAAAAARLVGNRRQSLPKARAAARNGRSLVPAPDDEGAGEGEPRREATLHAPSGAARLAAAGVLISMLFDER
ncbi:hypothetical protein GQ55_9G417600 [Panicum hallii var. hallii]|uniref:Uncharacterized protein n=1 Tax=Panicum hallii var. hallii TaxID=1504633 RepID=A0A2T7CAT8_9POAL|nr:hypothetical protein GQ55_9G417600 [Panicum hallii var. hallii]